MTIYDKGLLRAMKAAYKGDGYYVAVTEGHITIQTDDWGVQMYDQLVPNSIKSLIVLHNGCMPPRDSAVLCQKGECSSAFLEVVTGIMEGLVKDYTAGGGLAIKPTRLTFDGKRVWQLAEELDVRLVDVDHQQIFQILFGEKVNAFILGNTIFSHVPYGSLYIRTEIPEPEDKPLLQHLSGMQWIAVELG